MSTRNRTPDTGNVSLEPRRTALEDLDIEPARAVTPQPPRHLQLGLIKDLKLLFAALGAGNSVVPMGDNSHSARLLSEYARSLRAN
jgi:hypothetical protein